MVTLASPTAVLASSLPVVQYQGVIGAHLTALVDQGQTLISHRTSADHRHAAYMGMVAIAAQYPEVAVPDPEGANPQQLARAGFYEDAYAEITRTLRPQLDRRLTGSYLPEDAGSSVVAALEHNKIGDLGAAARMGLISDEIFRRFVTGGLLALHREISTTDESYRQKWEAHPLSQGHPYRVPMYTAAAATLFFGAFVALLGYPAADAAVVTSIMAIFSPVFAIAIGSEKRRTAENRFYREVGADEAYALTDQLRWFGHLTAQAENFLTPEESAIWALPVFLAERHRPRPRLGGL